MRTQKYLHFCSMTTLKIVTAIFSSIFGGHLVTLKLSSIEPSQYLDGWPGAIKKWTSKKQNFFFSLSALFLRGTLFFNRYIILHTEKKWIKESNRHPFQFSWFQQKWKYSLRAKYTRYNLPNELIWSKIEWKSLKWRKKV